MNILEITHQDKRDLAAWEVHPSLPQAVKLLDGTIVTVRAIRPDDAPRLQALFDRLSQDTIYLRFLSHRKALSKQQAAHLANVNYVTQMALVATREQEDIVGVARYAATNPDQPDRAEAAIVVGGALAQVAYGARQDPRYTCFPRHRPSEEHSGLAIH